LAEIKVFPTTTSETLKELNIPSDKLLSMFGKMVLARRFEEKVEELYLKMALITGPCHLYLGMEAIASGASEALTPDDFVLATYRGHGHAVARDVPLDRVFAELMGRVDGTCKGLGGSMHAATWMDKNLILATAIVGSNIPMAAGVGLAIKKKGLDRVVVSYFGDGAVNSGAFNEGVNLAAVWRVPAIFVCENNQYAMSLPGAKGFASESIAARGASFGIPASVADGNDPVSVYRAASEARAVCSSGSGPAFVEARTYRMKGHGIYDKAEYRPVDEPQKWAEKDPIITFERLLLESRVTSPDELDGIRKRVETQLDEAVRKARASPHPEFSTLETMVYPRGD
jgi:TPP-dependent pyruvate/acetoin dehydrogenase alpha subunit